MSTAAMVSTPIPENSHAPSKGRVGIACLIIAESAIFVIFVVAYLYYLGKDVRGPTPQKVLTLPILNSICLLSSSFTIVVAVRALGRGMHRQFLIWWVVTIALGAYFLIGTAREWQQLIYGNGLTIQTNLFGTTFYSLVGLHACHVIAGLIMLFVVAVLTLTGTVRREQSERVDVLSLYWHFVDAVWVVVFTVVYVIGR